MVTKIKWAFEENLQHVSWMDSETKKAAKEKVRSFWHVAFRLIVGGNSTTWRESRSDAGSLLFEHRQTPSTTCWDIQTSS